MSEVNAVLRFDWPAPEPLQSYVEQAREDEIDEAPFEALPVIAEEIEEILEEYPGSFYRVESVEVESGRVSLEYFLDEDVGDFMESLMLIFAAVGARGIEAFLLSEADNTAIRLSIEDGQVWEEEVDEVP